MRGARVSASRPPRGPGEAESGRSSLRLGCRTDPVRPSPGPGPRPRPRPRPLQVGRETAAWPSEPPAWLPFPSSPAHAAAGCGPGQAPRVPAPRGRRPPGRSTLCPGGLGVAGSRPSSPTSAGLAVLAGRGQLGAPGLWDLLSPLRGGAPISAGPLTLEVLRREVPWGHFASFWACSPPRAGFSGCPQAFELRPSSPKKSPFLPH